MEWKNYLEITHDHDLLNRYLLNTNENLGSNNLYINTDNNIFNDFKKYLPNYQMNNFQEENNDKNNYFNLLNDSNISNSDFYNLDEKSYLSPINQEENDEKKVDKLSSESFNNGNKEIGRASCRERV